MRYYYYDRYDTGILGLITGLIGLIFIIIGVAITYYMVIIGLLLLPLALGIFLLNRGWANSCTWQTVIGSILTGIESLAILVVLGYCFFTSPYQQLNFITDFKYGKTCSVIIDSEEYSFEQVEQVFSVYVNGKSIEPKIKKVDNYIKLSFIIPDKFERYSDWMYKDVVRISYPTGKSRTIYEATPVPKSIKIDRDKTSLFCPVRLQFSNEKFTQYKSNYSIITEKFGGPSARVLTEGFSVY